MRHLFSPTVASMNPLLKVPEWDDPAGGCSVVGSRMWSVHSIVHRLRRIHLTFGMAVLAVVIGRAVSSPVLEMVAVALAGVMLVTLGLTTGPVANSRLVLVLTALSTLAGLGVLIWGLFALVGFELGPRVEVSDTLTYEVALILGVAAGLGLLGELLTSRLRGGWVPLGLLAVATLIGGTLGLTGSMLVETYLSESATTNETFDGGAAFATVGMLGLVIVTAVTFVIATFIPKPGNDGSRVRRGILRARLILGVAGVYGAAFGAVAAMLSCQGATPGCSHRNLAMPDWVVEDPDNLSVLLGIPFDPASLLGWAKIVMVAVPALLIARSIVGGLLNGQDARRQVGILWDLGSFWPRWFHPLAPPAYGPYAVARLQTILSEEKPEVLSAHSQGSLIAAVALCLADEDDRPGLLVTYGSQLGDLYPSLFPAVGLDDLVDATARQVEGRWINLWRGSDAVGGQVVSELGSRNWEVTTGKGHSRYELTTEFCAARKAVVSGDLARPADTDMAGCWGGRP
jgi:MFS family permease